MDTPNLVCRLRWLRFIETRGHVVKMHQCLGVLLLPALVLAPCSLAQTAKLDSLLDMKW